MGGAAAAGFGGGGRHAPLSAVARAPGLAPSRPDVVSTPLDALLTTNQRNHVGPVLPPPSREGMMREDEEITTLQV